MTRRNLMALFTYNVNSAIPRRENKFLDNEHNSAILTALTNRTET